jgi:hypothetical protein
MSTSLNIELVKGNTAPRYTTDWKQLNLDKALITEEGMESKLPLVDLQLTDSDGNTHFTMVSGRIILALAEAIQGVNLRNHGSTNP